MNLSLLLLFIGVIGFFLRYMIPIAGVKPAIGFLLSYFIPIAGVKPAIGLGILIAFYRLRGSVTIEFR